VSLDVSDFNEVVLEGVGTLTIEQTGSETLTIEANDNIIPYLRTEVENGRLVISVEDNTTLRSTKPINYWLTVKNLNALTLSRSGDINTDAISTDSLEVSLPGSGNIEAADISTSTSEVKLTGSGSVKTAGRSNSQNVSISGSGSYQGEDLESEEAMVDVGGSGTATVNVSDDLDVSISGSGSVEYVGDPTVSQDMSGSGEVKKL